MKWINKVWLSLDIWPQCADYRDNSDTLWLYEEILGQSLFCLMPSSLLMSHFCSETANAGLQASNPKMHLLLQVPISSDHLRLATTWILFLVTNILLRSVMCHATPHIRLVPGVCGNNRSWHGCNEEVCEIKCPCGFVEVSSAKFNCNAAEYLSECAFSFVATWPGRLQWMSCNWKPKCGLQQTHLIHL